MWSVFADPVTNNVNWEVNVKLCKEVLRSTKKDGLGKRMWRNRLGTHS